MEELSPYSVKVLEEVEEPSPSVEVEELSPHSVKVLEEPPLHSVKVLEEPFLYSVKVLEEPFLHSVKVLEEVEAVLLEDLTGPEEPSEHYPELEAEGVIDSLVSLQEVVAARLDFSAIPQGCPSRDLLLCFG